MFFIIFLLFTSILCTDFSHLNGTPTKTLLFEADVMQNLQQQKAALAGLTFTLDAALSGLNAFSQGELHRLDPNVGDNKCQIRASILCTLAKENTLTEKKIKNIEDIQCAVETVLRHERVLPSLTQLIERGLNGKPIAEIITAEDEDLIKLFAATYGIEQSGNTLSHLAPPKPIATNSINNESKPTANKHRALQSAMKKFLINISKRHLNGCAEKTMLLQFDTDEPTTVETTTAIHNTLSLENPTQACNKPQSASEFCKELKSIFNNAFYNNVPIVLQQYVTCEKQDGNIAPCQLLRTIFAPCENRFKYLPQDEIKNLSGTSAALVIEDDFDIYDSKSRKYRPFSLCGQSEFHENEIFKKTSFDPLSLVFQNAQGHEANTSRDAQRERAKTLLGIPFCTTHIYATTLQYILGKKE